MEELTTLTSNDSARDLEKSKVPWQSSVEVRVLRSVPELEKIRTFWKSSPGHPESEMDFFLTLLRSNPDIVRPHVLVLYKDGKPDAILAGRVDKRPVDRLRIGYLRVKLRAKLLYFVCGALRGADSPENCELLVRELCRNLNSGEADLAYLNFLTEGSNLRVCAKNIPSRLCRDHVSHSQLHFSASIPRTMDEFYLRLSPKVRQTEKRKVRKVATEFSNDVRLRCFEDPSEVDLLAETAERIAKTSYQRALNVGFFDSSEERASLRLKAEARCLRGYVLYLAGCPCAFWIGDIDHGVFGSGFLGFDPAYAKHSPGMYLLLKVIETFCDEEPRRVDRIDFGIGPARYKELLSNEVWNEIETYIFAWSVKGVMLNFVKTAVTGTNSAFKSALDRAGVLEKIKKAWRVRLSRRQPTT